MGSVSLFSLFALGLDVHKIRVEVDVSPGLPAFHVVGLTDTVVQESKDRIRAAFTNSGFTFPRGKVIVNLAPANLHKTGSSFDLPIALGILLAEKMIPPLASEAFFIGELGLDGSIRNTEGTFLFAQWALAHAKELYIAKDALPFAYMRCPQPSTHGARTLLELVTTLRTRTQNTLPNPSATNTITSHSSDYIDLSDIVGHRTAKRALEIAAVGKHHLCLWGSPGTGKSMLAKALQGILPSLTDSQWSDLQRIHSIRTSIEPHASLSYERPFRAPHHTTSSAALIGGGSFPRPGEVSLAHHGILFLDELAEFPRGHIDQLRQPLSEKTITIGRAKYTHTFPADFQLVAATNPCPCGYYGDVEVPCTCLETTRKKYIGKISGPILDRIDLHVHVRRQALVQTKQTDQPESTTDVRKRVLAAQTFAQAHNTQSTALTLKTISNFTFDAEPLHEATLLAQTNNLSVRSFIKLLRIARTIANLELSLTVKKPHLEEAWSFKSPLVF